MPNHTSASVTTDPQSAFRAFRDFVAEFDSIDLLSQLTLTFLFAPETEFIGEASPVRHWARWIEFTAGYLATCPIGDEPHILFEGTSIERFETLIRQYFDSLSIDLLTNRPASSERTPADKLLMSAKIESLYVRGDAYPHQFLEYAAELYGQHDPWFKSNLGFTIGEAIRIARAVPVELSRRVNLSLKKARTDAPRCGAFMSATNQLFGEGAARTAGGLWVEEFEACLNYFRGRDSDWRIVTISASNRLANRMDATRSTEKTCYGEGERQRLRKAPEKYLDVVGPAKYSHSHEREE